MTQMIGIPEKLQIQLREYLLKYESDIAWGINDFGDLKDLFEYIIGRTPKTEERRKYL